MGTNSHSYRYDPIGNRTVTTNNSAVTEYLANTLNQYSRITNNQSPITPSYDLDGNMTGYKDWTFVWDAENRLVIASNATTVVSNSYDYMSRRIGKVVYTNDSGSWILNSRFSFSYQGWAMIQERLTSNASLLTNSYVYGLDLSGTSQGAGTIGGILSLTTQQPSNSTTAFFCYDANGNVTDLVGTNGEFLAQYQFDPYGNTISKTGALADVNPFRFSTKYTDSETGLLYYGYRYYVPEIGRWASRDPIEEDGGMGLYCFLGNDVINNADLNGLKDVCCVKTGPEVTYTGARNEPTLVNQSFTMVVQYETDGTQKGNDCCKVSKCHFRQYVKGYFKLNGVLQTMHSSGSGLLIPANTRVNDGYNNDDDLDTDSYRFEAKDSPGVSGLASGDNIEYYLNFAARVLDSGSGWTTVAEKADYWVKFKGKHKRKLTYGGFN